MVVGSGEKTSGTTLRWSVITSGAPVSGLTANGGMIKASWGSVALGATIRTRTEPSNVFELRGCYSGAACSGWKASWPTCVHSWIGGVAAWPLAASASAGI
jgi:hypothetical protein